jgi:hypothetical protein
MSYRNQGTGAVSGAMGVGAAGGGIAFSIMYMMLYAYIALWPITVPATLLYLGYLAIYEPALAWSYVTFVGGSISTVFWFTWPVVKWIFALIGGCLALMVTMFHIQYR